MRFFVKLTWLVPAVILTLAACGGGDGETNDGTDTVAPADTVAEDTVLPDEDVVAEEDNVVPPQDVPPVDETDPPETCDPACDFNAGEYCADDLTCQMAECTYCLKNNQCGDGETCFQFDYANGENGSFCTTECAGDDDCGVGEVCDGDPKHCVPVAACGVDNCGDGSPGDPCAFDMNVNGGCGECQADLTCYGIAPAEASPCETDQDCVLAGFDSSLNPDCVNGLCSASYCVAKCVDFDCDEGFEPVSAGLGKCVCIPLDTGNGEAGDACPIWNVFFEVENCGPDLTCLGIPAEEQEEDPTVGACETSADCEGYFGIQSPTDCVDGYCGTSFCSPLCDENEECEGDFGPIDVSGTCYCAPFEFGDSAAGDPCPFGADINPDADLCQKGLSCLGIAPDDESDECESAADCDAGAYPGGVVCVDGHCGTSFCSPQCDDEAECEEGFAPISVNDACLCQPTLTGDGMPGDACPFGVSNDDADYCDGALNCFGINADETVPCDDDSDCANPPYAGNATCVEGWCGTSFCSPKCDQDNECEEGFEPLTYEDFEIEKCNCAPEVPTGEAVAGDACPLFNVNVDADYCMEDLECVGDVAQEGAEACETAEDCSAGTLVAEAVCTLGYCASTACLAVCEAGATLCGDGAPYFYGECVCDLAFTVGEAAVGEACPYFTVNADANTCVEDLVCGGVAIFDESAECETADDCDGADHPGVIECLDGKCGSSACFGQCTDGECADGFDTLETDNELCFCVPTAE